MNKVLCTFMLVMGCMMTIHAQSVSKENISHITLTELQKNAQKYLGKTICFSGKTVHVCSRSGMKLFMQIPGSKATFQVNATRKLGKFPRTCNNHIVEIVGTVNESRIDEAYLQNWEKQIKNQTEEHHGEAQSGCESEKAAMQETANTSAKRIADFRKRIAIRAKKEGKKYLSFYNVTAKSYNIAK